MYKHAIIHPGSIKGQMQIPASKSVMQRICAAALLNKGHTYIYNPGNSDDDRTALSIIEKIGAQVEYTDQHIHIYSDGLNTLKNMKSQDIHCGESGLSIRMFTPIIALSEKAVTLTSHGSLSRRPLHFFEKYLPQVGVKVSTQQAHTPIRIQGPLQIKDIELDGSLSSQYITGFIMAYATACTQPTSIYVQDLNSQPYIELTLSVMQQFGMPIPHNDGYKIFTFNPSDIERHDVHISVEGDWSSASFLLVGGAIHGDIYIQGLNDMSTQADASILEVLEAAGADIHIDEEDRIHIQSSELHAFDFDATHCPDLFPPLVALACYCTGESRIKGIHRLLYKESNRAETLLEEFKKIGADIRLHEDYFYIQGGKPLHGQEVTSHHDHRIAMALAIAGLKATGEMRIHQADAVNKSYPDFWMHLQSLGLHVQLS